MNRERVQVLRDHIAGLPDDDVQLNDYVSRRSHGGCGVVCCLAGWTCALFDKVAEAQAWRAGVAYNYKINAIRLLALTPDEVQAAYGEDIGGFYGAYRSGPEFPREGGPFHHKAQALARLDALLALPEGQ